MSNLYKSAYVVQKETKNRVIDSNEMVAQKIQKLTEIMEAQMNQSDEDYDGFIEGLNAEQVESLLEDPDAVMEAPPEPQMSSAEEQVQSARDELEQLRMQADAVVEDAKASAKDIMAKAEADAAAAFEEAKANGHNEGYNEGYREGIQKAKETEDRLMEQDNQRQMDYEAALNELEPMLIGKLCEIYEHVIGVDLSGRSDVIMYLLAKAIRTIEGGINYLLHISPDDIAYVGEHKGELTALLGSVNTLELIEDITLTQGNAFIETESGIYDCSLGVELELLKKELKLLSRDDN